MTKNAITVRKGHTEKQCFRKQREQGEEGKGKDKGKDKGKGKGKGKGKEGRGNRRNAQDQDQSEANQAVSFMARVPMEAPICLEQDQDHSYMHSDNDKGTEYGTRRGESGGEDEVDASYLDQFCFFQLTHSFPRTKPDREGKLRRRQGRRTQQGANHHDHTHSAWFGSDWS